MTRRWKTVCLLILSLMAFALFLNGPDIVTSHEARVALPARQMAEAGWPWSAKNVPVPPVKFHPGVVRLAPDWDGSPILVNPWLVPVMNGQIRLQKPPLPYWCAAICFRLFGGFSEWALRLVPALFGAFAVFLIYDLGRILYGRRVGWLAGLVWVSTYTLPDEYRKAMADPYLAFFTLGCLWSWARAGIAEGRGNGEGGGENSAWGRGDAGTRRGEDAGTRGRGDGESGVESVEGGGKDAETRRRGDAESGVEGVEGGGKEAGTGGRGEIGDSVFIPNPSFPASPRPRVSASHPPLPAFPHPRVSASHPPLSASPRPRVSASHPPLLSLAAFYLCFAFALLAKGPPALVDILLPLAVFQVLFRRRIPGSIRLHLVSLLFVLLIALPWPLYVWRNVPHALELWRYESVGELTDNTENARPFWFYLPQLLFLSLPWTAIALLGVARQIARMGELFDNWMRRRLERADAEHAVARSQAVGESFSTPVAVRRTRSNAKQFFPITWYALMVAFFSCVHLKKNQYLLPAMPAQCLLVAQGFAVLWAGVHRRRFSGASGALVILQIAIGVAFAGGIIVLMVVWHLVTAASCMLCVLTIAAALLPWLAVRRRWVRAWPVLQALAYVVLILAFWRVYLTPSEDNRSPKRVAMEVAELSREPGYTVLTLRLPEEMAVYLPSDVHYDFRARHVLMIIDDQHGVRTREQSGHTGPIPTPSLKGSVPDARIKEIRRLPMKSAPGDARWKVYELTVDRSVYTLREPADSIRCGKVAGRGFAPRAPRSQERQESN